MPTIRFPQKSLRTYLKRQPSDEELQRAISMIGTDLDSFGEEVSVEVFPNRPDLLSVPGLARAINHFLEYSDGADAYDVKRGDGVVKVLKSAAGVRPHTRVAIVRGLDLSDERIKEMIDMQEKLHVTFGRQRKKLAIGIYPLEKIVLPITFGAEKPEDIIFRPLEADKEMSAKQLLIEHPTGRKYAHLLTATKTFPVFRDSEGKVLSVPPVINSHDVGKVSVDTTEVFIECSGHDARVLEQGINIICCALADMGGSVESMALEYPDWHLVSPGLTPQRMKIDRDYVCSRSGVPKEKLEDSLGRMGLALEGDEAIIPSYRTDFLHPVDVVEDAAIGYGYNNLESRVPSLYTVGALSFETIVSGAVREVLSGMRLQEVMTYFLTGTGVALANPLTQEYAALRSTLLHSLLDALGRNINNSYPQRVFEVGPVFFDAPGATTRVDEELRVSAILCQEDADYTAARQSLEALCRAMEWTVSFEEYDDERFIPGRCARVSGDVVGVVGEIHPEGLASRQVQMPAAGWEVTLPR